MVGMACEPMMTSWSMLGRSAAEGLDVGGGGAGKPILPGLDGLHEALVASQITDLYPVPHQRTDALPAEFSSGPALQQPLRRADVVEAAEGLFNAAPAQKLTT